MHFMFSSLIYMFVNELRSLINNIFEDSISLQYYVSVMNILIYIFSLIGFMIYLEIVELNFCKLNYNLRKYIKDRSDNDSFEDDNRESIIVNHELKHMNSQKIKTIIFCYSFHYKIYICTMFYFFIK